MPIIELRFPAGRLHATPWGRHVNEGAVEWPPSPWRILRALLATWYLKATADVPEPIMRELVLALASKPPVFQLPPASLGHTRHFMPDNASYHKEGGQKTFGPGKDKVFDAFIHLGGPLRIAWDVLLSAEQNHALALLCARLSYFGRAESIVEAKALLVDTQFKPDARELLPEESVPPGNELIRLLSPSEEKLRQLQAGQSAAPTAPPAKRARGKAAQTSRPPLPADIFAALHAVTGDLQRAGWTLPPGSRLVDYIRPENSFDLQPVRSRPRPSSRPTVARFAIQSAVLPRITRALSVAERVHQALLARFPNGSAPELFAGRDKNGKPLSGHHHAFIFCEPNGPRDAITHISVFAAAGFDAPARRALEALEKVWGHGGHDLQLVLLGFGEPNTFEDAQLFRGGKVWRSLTPFISTRHPKTHRDGRPKLDSAGWPIGSPAHDLRRLIAEVGLPAPEKLEILPEIAVNSRTLNPLEFQTERRHGNGARAHQPPSAFQITFAKPVNGPLAFGYGAHFGLGLFVPAQIS
jgi:CRISPR-associated protein Csb2